MLICKNLPWGGVLWQGRKGDLFCPPSCGQEIRPFFEPLDQLQNRKAHEAQKKKKKQTNTHTHTHIYICKMRDSRNKITLRKTPKTYFWGYFSGIFGVSFRSLGGWENLDVGLAFLACSALCLGRGLSKLVRLCLA